ncbi:hypothetical protein [Achromobacter marplatensis]|uniref:Uncharacterized protein n=1 Tax=Achromobacter marplatensis TaxID=470868 RepID=A0AA43B1Y2_9BURK|nr:hypothetical protein [Achromobacter marplatensis]MDH2051199.1 hypothetical protein [Achromobacter marplatensis]
MNTNNGWKLVPVEPTSEMWAAVNKLDDQMAAGGYDGKGASIEQVWNCLVETAPEAPPLTVTVDPDPRGVSVGVYLGSSCVYHGAHEVPAPATGDALDAARYRWLCDKFGVTKLPCAIERIIEGKYVADGKESIDAAIDAAIAASQQGGE